MKLPVLDHGSVELMSHTPDGDLLVVNAARCSFDKEKYVFGGKDDRLIHYLARHLHLLPFRHPSASIRIVAPLFVLRQLGKHQVGFSWSEISRRYIKSTPKFHVPVELRKSADNVKQGSSEEIINSTRNRAFLDDMVDTQDFSLFIYNRMIDNGVCPEQARMVLPQSMYTTTVTTGTLLGWNHLYKQRTEKHTQVETRYYAKAIGEILEHCFPVSWRALNENTSTDGSSPKQ
jgi:thymidylate synthase (FAD)